MTAYNPLNFWRNAAASVNMASCLVILTSFDSFYSFKGTAMLVRQDVVHEVVSHKTKWDLL